MNKLVAYVLQLTFKYISISTSAMKLLPNTENSAHLAMTMVSKTYEEKQSLNENIFVK